MNQKTVTGVVTRMAKAANGEDEITISTSSRDLQDDDIDLNGMDTDTYLNGTRAVNFAHNHNRVPIAVTTALTKTFKSLRARFRWIEGNPDAAIVRAAFDAGALGASIEFISRKATPNAHGGFHISKSTLTGWAFTGSPANPECVRMFKSLGLWTRDNERRVLRVRTNSEENALKIHRVNMGKLAARIDAAKKVIPAVAQAIPQTAAFKLLVENEIRKAINRHTGRVD